MALVVGFLWGCCPSLGFGPLIYSSTPRYLERCAEIFAWTKPEDAIHDFGKPLISRFGVTAYTHTLDHSIYGAIFSAFLCVTERSCMVRCLLVTPLEMLAIFRLKTNWKVATFPIWENSRNPSRRVRPNLSNFWFGERYSFQNYNLYCLTLNSYLPSKHFTLNCLILSDSETQFRNYSGSLRM